ncbi:MAG: metallophosphoesterase [Acidobacteria bacterium]|nr:metallophosphoesterase [Acidobacteriota bacterium]
MNPVRVNRAGSLWMLCFLLLFPFAAQAQKIYTYVGRIETDSVLLAWGTTKGSGNTIGRSSVSLGKVTVRVGNRQIASERNWVVVDGLRPDTQYTYEVTLHEMPLGNQKIGGGTVRTYPDKSRKLAFFVIGDYGTGKPQQYEVAEAMWREFEQRRPSDNPVRFVLTTGDNIYADRILGFIPTKSGNKDSHWESKFFQPYERLLKSIPFYPTLGNHDSKGSESTGDLGAYLDNFFFPAPEPARYYTFSFGGLAEFFALDTTSHTTFDTTLGTNQEALRQPNPGGQMQWLRQALAAAKAPWKIAYYHHPPFNAGPGHGASLHSLRPLVDLSRQSGVQVVFNGHEHNFQFSERNEKTGNVRYVITGAGGMLRRKDIRGNMQDANIAGWAPQSHFLLVEIEDRTMKITPLSSEAVDVRDKDGHSVPLPIVIHAAEPEGTSSEFLLPQASPPWFPAKSSSRLEEKFPRPAFSFRAKFREHRHD